MIQLGTLERVFNTKLIYLVGFMFVVNKFFIRLREHREAPWSWVSLRPASVSKKNSTSSRTSITR